MFRARLIRPDDLLNLDIEGPNLVLDASDPSAPVVVVEDPVQPAFLIVRFPPQTVVEEATFETDEPFLPTTPQKPMPSASSGPPPTVPVRSRIGGETRLVLHVPADRRIPYSIDGLLDWAGLRLSVSPLADLPTVLDDPMIAAAPPIAAPSDTETAIELPYRIVLSPTADVVWRHEAAPVSHHGRTELWHTLIAHAFGDGALPSEERPIPLRAVWSPDYSPARFHNTDPPLMGRPDQDWDTSGGGVNGVLTAMTPSDRHEIVVLTSGFHGYVRGLGDVPGEIDRRPFVPTPIDAALVILSPLGGYLKSRGRWQPPMPTRIPRIAVESPNGGVFRDLTDYVLHPIEVDPFHIDDPLIDPDPPFMHFLAAERPMLDVPLDVGVLAPQQIDELLVRGNLRRVRDDLIVPIRRDEQQFVQIPREYGASLNVSEWVHNATLGRDHYVRIVYEGSVYPLGHRAALIKVTERKIRDAAGGPVAYLAQRMFVVIRKPDIDYGPERASDPTYGRQMPLTSVRLTTLITPDIEQPNAIPGTESSFVITVAGEPFRFNAVGTDIAGNDVGFTTTLIFMPNSDAITASINAVRTRHLALGPARACLVPGQRIAYADEDRDSPSDNTALITSDFHLATVGRGADPAAYFLPMVFAASVRLPAVEQLLGRDAATTIAWAPAYIASGYGDGNETGLFARIAQEDSAQLGTMVDRVLGAEFSADQAGGVATPAMSISGLTRALGPMAGADLMQIARNEFDPTEFFKSAGSAPKLFGSIPLTEVIDGGSLSDGAPTLQTKTEDVGGDPLVKRMTATFAWNPKVRTVDVGFVSLVVGADTRFSLRGRVERTVALPPAVAPGGTVSEFEGVLENFDIVLLEVVTVGFERFRFTSRSGAKPEVNIAMKNPSLSFAGDLSFVNELQKFIPAGMFGDGASLDISSTRVKAGFGIALPPISIGVFSLDGVALNASVELPFADGKPMFDFSVSTREHPFCLTVAFLGGGGFFHLQVDTAGVRLLEAALEFGAAIAVDLGVASGGVHVMAGVYFAMGKKNGADYSILSGYLRMGGELSVLGLISISLEFMLSFGYEAGKAAGRATLTVKVEVLFFSTSVEITVEKKFGGSNGDPRFAQVIETPAVWDQYASAFA